MNKIHLPLCLFFFINSLTLLAQPHTIFISKFEIKTDSLKEVLRETIALDFEKILSNYCTKKYNVLKREYYKNWILKERDTTNIQKHQLNASEVDYHLFGEISYNHYKGKYIIEYALEKIDSMSLQFIDSIAFNTYDDLMNQKLRQVKIFKRLIEELMLCK